MPDITIRLPRFIPIRHRDINLTSTPGGSSKADILSGLTVALALVPEAVAFAFLAGVPPLVGLYAAFIICLITSVLGGRPGMISGATGAMGVVVVALVANHGIGYLFPAVVLCGMIQVTVGLLKLGRFIRIVPHPVMLGFVNGLAIVILLAQLGSFKTLGDSGAVEYLQGTRLYLMLGLVAVTMAIIAFLPRLTKAVPSSLAAILVVSIAAFAINRGSDSDAPPLLTVGDMLVDNTRAAAVGDAQTAKDAALLARDLPSINVAVRRADDALERDLAEFALRPAPGSRGSASTTGLDESSRRYTAPWLANVSGTLELVVTDPALSGLDLRVPLDVIASDDELRRAEADVPRLVRLAEATGGRVVPLDDLSQLAEPVVVRNLSRKTANDLAEPFWNSALALALVVGLITLEWIGRKLVRLV